MLPGMTSARPDVTQKELARAAETPSPAYARYVLGVLLLVYIFNFIDRNIVSILAEELKRDLGLTDDQIGFLYGTAFAVFYAVFGIPLGAVADAWDRRRLIAIGLGFWSAMTAVSGLARGFTGLGLARVGVGVGEASASPAAYSLLADYFPAERRTTAFAIYSSGVYIGGGIGIFLGGWILDGWSSLFPEGSAPFGLRGWQVAYFAVGLPGLLLALWVNSLREPVRGARDGLAVKTVQTSPLQVFTRELLSLLPGTGFFQLRRAGASGSALAMHWIVAAAVVAATAALIAVLGSPAQWLALGLGVFAAFSWSQGLALRDPASHALIVRTPSLRYIGLAFAFLSFSGYGFSGFTPPYFLRTLGVSPGEVALGVGFAAAIGGWLGVTAGGVIGDALLPHTRKGRLYVGMIASCMPVPLAFAMLSTSNPALAYLFNFVLVFFASMWLGAGQAAVQELVLPRMRATASAAYLLVLTLIGLGLGPYTVGRLSVATGSLSTAMQCCLVANGLALLCLVLAARTLERDESTKLERARAAGESAH
jgi:MFS family permease